MLESMQRKQELESALNQYLHQAKEHPILDSLDLVKTGDYAYVFGMSAFDDAENEDLVYFLVPIEAEIKLLNRIDCVFNSQVSPRTVRNSLSRTIQEIGVFPLSTDEQVQLFNEEVFKRLNFHFERQYDAIVPLYQIECSVEFPLANSVLHPGGERSETTQIAKDDTSKLHDTDRKQIENCSYLKFRVTGDNDSRLKQVEEETQQALQVLRYLYPWFEKDGKPYNSSHAVSTWKQSARTILYQRVLPNKLPTLWDSRIPEGIFQPLNDEFLSDVKKYLLLEELNFHFRNRDRNPVSQRFCRAFKYYEIASLLSDADVALANFTICVDILLPSGNAKELTKYLISLIENGDLYEGKMTLDEQLSDPDKTGWPERVRLTVSDYKAFYIIRDKVVHGNTMSDIVSDMQVKKSRQIAKNAIRAYAKLSWAFNWQSDKEAKNWFKHPCKPSK